MIERLPSLNITRPVTNIGEQDFAYIERDLAHRGSYLESQEAHQMFTHTGRLRAIIVSHGEIERLHRIIGFGSGKAAEEQADKLKEHIDDILPDFSRQPISVPTLPCEVHPHRRRKSLTIATSPEVMQERLLVKEAIRNFYGLDSVPNGVWLSDERVARVRLARSRNAAGNRAIDKIEAALKIGAMLLPEYTELAKVDIRRLP